MLRVERIIVSILSPMQGCRKCIKVRWYAERGRHCRGIRMILFILVVKCNGKAISALETVIIALVVGRDRGGVNHANTVHQWLILTPPIIVVVIDATQHAIRSIGRLHLHLHGRRVHGAFHLLHLDVLILATTTLWCRLIIILMICRLLAVVGVAIVL